MLTKIDKQASKLNKNIQFTFQVNISREPQKRGIPPEQLLKIIAQYTQNPPQNCHLIGLMTIGAQVELSQRRSYFRALKDLFDQINHTHFPEKPLTVLSMGMSQDYQIAIQEGATMVRIGRALSSF